MIENLEIQKEETEIIIQKLENAINEIEKIADNSSFNDYNIQKKLKGFIAELEKEIEYNEQILDETNQSIIFEQLRELRE